MTKDTLVTEVLETKYQCPCGTTYKSKDEAEQCASPCEPRFQVGDWVETSRKLTFPNPAYDHGFGNEEPYDFVPRGTAARIEAVHDRYDDDRGKHPRQWYSYSFDKGEWPLTAHTVGEETLAGASDAARTRIAEKIKTLSAEVKKLEEIAQELKK